MKIQKNNTGILITKTAKQPSAKIEFSLDELDALSEFCERLQDEKDIREYLNTAVTIPDSAEVSAPIAVKYLHDAALFEQLMDETRRNQEENQSNFLTAVSDAVSSIEKSRDVKEWHGLTKATEKFSDGHSMDIRCCGDEDTSWAEAILYDNTGVQVAITETYETFIGYWELDDETTGKTYRVNVVTVK